MQKFKNIIFDLGGVLLDVDFSKTEKAFIDLGITNFHEFFNQHHSSPLFARLEVGEISSEEFYDEFRKACGVPLTDHQIEKAWNALIGDFEEAKLDWLEKMSEKYNVYLFSNTNEIHHRAFQEKFRALTGKASFDDYFIRAWYSHEVGVRKPDEEAFKKVLQLGNLEPAETLFVDDTIGNIEAAKKAGLLTLYLKKPASILEVVL